MSESDSLNKEKRQDARFLCVGVELLYSLVDKKVVSNVAEDLFHAITHDISLAGMAFDIEHEMKTGECLLVTVKSPDSADEMLKTEVRWCKAVNERLYRVGVSITSVIKQATDSGKAQKIETLEMTDGVPSRASFVCPSCHQRSWFVLLGKQEGTPYPTILPLYNCGHCKTTQTIQSLLSFNRSNSTGGG